MRLPITIALTLLLLGCPARRDGGPPPTHEIPPEPESMRTDEDDAGGLPAQVGAWRLAGEAQTITDAQGLFEAMNGAGELYLAYRFTGLQVRRYDAADAPEIVVEIYELESADDAFGLLSWDWSGEPWGLGRLRAESRRVLYEGGLLRLAAGTRFARVLIGEDSEAGRAALREIGTALVADAGPPTTPRLIQGLPEVIGEGPRQLFLRPDRTVFLRSPLVLNEAYFLAWDNVLQLDRDVDAVHAVYRADRAAEAYQVHALRLRYPDGAAAEAGLASFRAAYLAGSLEVREVEAGVWELHRIEAAETVYGLGVGDLARIDVEKIGWQDEALI